jgi:TolB protein
LKSLATLATMLWLSFLSQPLIAESLTIRITEGIQGASPIAIVPFGGEPSAESAASTISEVITADLARSGFFRVLPQQDLIARPHSGDQVNFKDWRLLNTDSLVVGQVDNNGVDGYLVRFQLFDVYRGEQLAGFSGPTTASSLRQTAHQIADIIFEKLTGIAGAFATRIAYVTADRQADGSQLLALNIADSDGYGPQTIVSSPEPLLSPAWSPDGQRIAYVSLEQRQASIYIQEIFTGKRTRIAAYPGLNGAPSWSPDGRKLALTLSKDGSPDIYVLDIASRTLQRITDHYAIDTEASWSPDGRHLVFTSDRGGNPQIYRVAATGGSPERLTFENSYNARASYAPDGRRLVLTTRVQGQYRIATLDLDNRLLQVISKGNLDESPSFAPNGSMVLYASKEGSRGVLAAVSVDGRVHQQLATQSGDVREPDWSPKY